MNGFPLHSRKVGMGPDISFAQIIPVLWGSGGVAQGLKDPPAYQFPCNVKVGLGDWKFWSDHIRATKRCVKNISFSKPVAIHVMLFFDGQLVVRDQVLVSLDVPKLEFDHSALPGHFVDC